MVFGGVDAIVDHDYVNSTPVVEGLAIHELISQNKQLRIASV
jgi:hypothetical protein